MTNETIRISVFQPDTVWEKPEDNRAKIDELLQEIPEKTDLVFLPEMFTTGFSMNVSVLAESMDGETVKWMKRRCKELNLALCGSLIIRENDDYFNRLIFVEPGDEIHFYNKRHLFTMGNEVRHFQKGTERLIVTYMGWRICPLICYDLRFPVWSRNRDEYDILFYSANWPQARTEVWNTLLKARAIENQAWVVGANRVGMDGNHILYSGNSQLIDPMGNSIESSKNPDESIISAEFSYSELLKFKSDFPVLNDADQFSL